MFTLMVKSIKTHFQVKRMFDQTKSTPSMMKNMPVYASTQPPSLEPTLDNVYQCMG